MSALPTGTVTFLFTDIEGSTRLLQALGDRYAELLADHSRIMRSAIAGGRGTEVGTEGDSFFAVFPTATGAVEAAVSAQQSLAAHAWPDRVRVAVRMGLHTGDGRLGGDNYVGMDVHRAARIAAAGHGGQVLLSETTRSLVERALPGGVSLKALGAHRLKDLANPEHVAQLEIAGLPNDFAELRSLDARPNNLPQQLTSFVGREEDLTALKRRLESDRLITLTGPGGTGKTRLALQLAAEHLDRFPDGVFFVELAPITDPALVPQAVADVLHVREAADQSLVETLHAELQRRELLMVLDNFEHVIQAASFVSELLASTRRLRILVTSRALLHVRGEHDFPVPPLRIPDPAQLPTTEALSQFEGVALFVARAQDVRPDFTVTNSSAPAIAEIVARLDGLPLAIELAAAKTRVLNTEGILARLGSRLSFLAGGPRDAPARQQTLRQAIDWSYGLLPDGEQALLRRLSVFHGGWTIEGLEAVCLPAEIGLDGLDALGALVDQSLARNGSVSDSPEPRFMMLETIREYAREQLEANDEADATGRRHAEYFLAFAEATAPLLTDSVEAIERVAADHDNIRAALSWAIETQDANVGLRLGYAVWRFWHQRGHLREGREWFEKLLAIPIAIGGEARLKGLTGAGGIAYWQNDYPAAETWYTEAESIAREIGNPEWLVEALFNTVSMLALRGEIPQARIKVQEVIRLATDLGSDEVRAQALGYDGYAAFLTDDFDTARDELAESLRLTERTGNGQAIAQGHHMVAQVARLQGRQTDAAEHYRAALQGMHALGDAASLTEPLQGLAAIAIAAGEDARGVRLLAANGAIRERLGGGPPPEWLRLGDPLADAKARLSNAAYEEAWKAGLTLSVDDAVADALQVNPAISPT